MFKSGTKSLIIGGNPNNDSNYVYHSVLGNGSCFINCYLESCLKNYRNEQSISKKLNIAKKFRIDFANFLLSESKKPAEKISARLNILNPSIMSTFVKLPNGDSSFRILEEISLNYNENVEDIEELIYSLIISQDLRRFDTGEPVTYNEIKYLYETDHRLNVCRSEQISSKTKIDPAVYGYGKIPINIGFYEIATSIGADYKAFLKSIDILLDHTQYLENLESTLIARFLGINTLVFPINSSYPTYFPLTEKFEGAPLILMVNLGNVHWDLIIYSKSKTEAYLFDEITENTKISLFNNLKVALDVVNF